jgi:hypothetical protein
VENISEEIKRKESGWKERTLVLKKPPKERKGRAKGKRLAQERPFLG